ncbi:iron ABC transporter permease [bacterium]|nr:iron ABC transporter permease [bacterium]
MMLQSRKPLFWLLLFIVAYPLAAFVVIPILRTLWESFLVDGRWNLSAYRTAFGADSSGWQALSTSVLISLGTVAGAALVGVPVAFLLGRVDFPGRRLASVLVIFPLALPPLVGVLSFMFLFESYGVVPLALQALLGLDRPPFRLTGLAGVLVVHIYSLFPFYTVFVAQALRGLDRSLEESSMALGAGRLRTLRRVTLPMLRPALMSATLLVFMTSMASFSAPYLFALNHHFLSTDIFLNKINNNNPQALALTVVLAGISLAFLGLIRKVGPGRVLGGGKGSPAPLRQLRSPAARRLAATAAAAFCLLVLLPHFMIAFLAFVKTGGWTHTVLPEHYTLENFRRMFVQPMFFAPIVNSVKMAGMAAVAVGVFGLMAALLVVRGRFAARGLLEMAVMLPWALPGTVIAISLIVSLSQPHLLTGGVAWAGSVWLLPVAYFVRFMPLGVRSTASALEQLDPALEEASASLGAGPLRTFRRVLLPLLWPGCLAGMLFTFITAVGEYTSSILLYVPDNMPISIKIDIQSRIPDLGGASAYSVLLLALVLGALYASRKSLRVGDQIRL